MLRERIYNSCSRNWELKNYVLEHWIFDDEDSDADEDNVSEEPDADQLEFDFDTNHFKPN